jgi:hypothetical protein
MSGSLLDLRAVDLTEFTNIGNEPSTTDLPVGLDVPDVLHPRLQEMWRTSPTFRRQCARLAEASVALTVRIGLPGGTTNVQALSRIELRGGVAQRAMVFLEPKLLNVHQLLAHEIEHVVEQIDGVNLKHLAINGVRGVNEHGGVYETSRAVAIGRLVAREVSRQ